MKPSVSVSGGAMVVGSQEQAVFVRRMSFVFIAAAFFVMTSQNVMAPNLTAVAESFGLVRSLLSAIANL